MTQDGFWLFAYGSLMARPALPWAERVEATLPGYRRRFWQGSHDHRGVPGAPGRVLTLVPTEGAPDERDERAERGEGACEGLLYFLPPAVAKGALARLDYREKNGYLRCTREVQDRFGVRRRALVYLATPENPAWLGPAPRGALVAQLCTAQGPSGRNIDYLRALHRTLRQLRITDPHIEGLMAAAGHYLNPAGTLPAAGPAKEEP
jgi:cation transport regulator ChaC